MIKKKNSQVLLARTNLDLKTIRSLLLVRHLQKSKRLRLMFITLRQASRAATRTTLGLQAIFLRLKLIVKRLSPTLSPNLPLAT